MEQGSGIGGEGNYWVNNGGGLAKDRHGLWPTRAEIDLNAIAHNVRQVRRLLDGDTLLLAVVKADGYGHGAVPVAKAALAAGASWLGVAMLEEAEQIRGAEVTAPLLVMGYLPPEQAGRAVGLNVRLTVFDAAVARALSAQAVAAGCTAKVHMKIDTGMGRIGLPPQEAVPFARYLQTLPGLELEGVFTHLATAEEIDTSYTEQQLRQFDDVLAVLAADGFDQLLRHAANSAAALVLPASRYDLVRVGIALYGLTPDPHRDWPVDLQPAMSLKSHVVQVKTLAPGARISYGGVWSAAGGEQLATVHIGYADGYRRLFSNRGEMLIQGKRCQVVGRISMDQTMVVVPPGISAKPGDEAMVLGRQGQAVISADDWAAALDTINYEIVCLIGKRVQRVYLGRNV